METSEKTVELELEVAVVIVDFGLGSKVLKTAKQHGIQNVIILMGSGTLNNRILEFLCLADTRKEVVLMASDKASITTALDAIDERFHFDKPFHGIAFTMQLHSLMGHGMVSVSNCNQLGRGDTMYRSLIIVVDRGETERIMETATKAGARGGTIMKARSAAEGDDSGSLFGIDLEPEKDVLLILAKAEVSETIIDAIRKTHAIGTEGKGVLICQDVNTTYGVK